MRLLILVLFLIPAFTYTQKNVLVLMDSAVQKEFYSYNLSARANFFIEPDSTLFYAQKCKELAIKNDNLYGKLIAQNLLGYGYYLKGYYATAVETFLSNLKIIEAVKESKRKNIVLLETNDGLGCAYCEADFFEQGMPYLYKALELAKIKQNKESVTNELGSIGAYYEKWNRIDSAEHYLNQAFSLATEFDFDFHKPWILISIGNCKKKGGKIWKAVEHWEKAIQYEGSDNIATSEGYINLGEFYLERNVFDSAYFYLTKAITNAYKANKIQNIFKANNNMLSYFKKINNQDSINHYLNICYPLKDTVSEQEKIKNLQTIYFNEQLRQQSINEAKAKSKTTTIYIVFFVILCALILISVLQYRNNRQKQKAKTEIEKAYSELAKTHDGLKSTQAQLIQSEKMAYLGELTAGIAHEIQNPLNFVNNFSDLNKEMLDEMKMEIEKGNYNEVKNIATDVIENETKINHHGKRAGSIVKGMLEHSRKSSGVKEPTDINKLCDEFLRLSYHGLRAKDKDFNCDYKLDLDPSIPLVNVVSQDIGRVLLNIINNAFQACNEKSQNLNKRIKHTKSQSDADQTLRSPELVSDSGVRGNNANYSPFVTLSTTKLGNRIEIRISDNGPGIPNSIKDKIFQPFFTTKPTGQGTGLGLSLAYDIVTKAHDGTLEVESTEGVGSEFVICLPKEV